jgi:hypothetical protein
VRLLDERWVADEPGSEDVLEVVELPWRVASRYAAD